MRLEDMSFYDYLLAECEYREKQRKGADRMRLIDADYVTEKLNEINGTAELDKAFEVVENAPTVDVLEQIRAEIATLPTNNVSRKFAFEVIDKYRVLQIIDKHMK